MAATKRAVLILTAAGHELAAVDAYAGPPSITVKRIGWRRLAEAEKANIVEAFSNVRQMGGPKFIKEIQDARNAAVAKAKEDGGIDAATDPLVPTAADLLDAYDKASLLYAGIEGIDGCDPKKELGPVIDDLEPEVADAVALEILRLSRPSLFETEADRKNG